MTTQTGYCNEGDLLITNGVEAAPGDRSKFIDLAQADMDSKLGFIYQVPIDLDAATLPANQKNLVKTIAIKLATGRLLMAAGANTNEQVNAYALYLIHEAEMDLMKIANGEIDLNAPHVDPSGEGVGLVPDPTVADPFARIPTGWNPDSTSAVTLFEQTFMTPNVTKDPWIPDDNVIGHGERPKLR